MTTDEEPPKHDDPAVQALIDDGWLGDWEEPITLWHLEQAARLVREADKKANTR